MNKQGLVKRCQYRSFGPQLQQDVLTVELDVEGEHYEHEVPNSGWSYNTPTLCLMGYLGIQPTDFDGGEYTPSKEVEVSVVWHDHMNQYVITGQVFGLGSNQLQNADWFEPDGQVYNSQGQGAGGMNVEPGTGNQGTVEVETGGENR